MIFSLKKGLITIREDLWWGGGEGVCGVSNQQEVSVPRERSNGSTESIFPVVSDNTKNY